MRWHCQWSITSFLMNHGLDSWQADTVYLTRNVFLCQYFCIWLVAGHASTQIRQPSCRIHISTNRFFCVEVTVVWEESSLSPTLQKQSQYWRWTAYHKIRIPLISPVVPGDGEDVTPPPTPRTSMCKNQISLIMSQISADNKLRGGGASS